MTLTTNDSLIRILLVDDQTILCEMMQTWLEREPDFQVVGSANNGAEAIAQVEQQKPDVVMLDIQMPGMDGVTAAGIICQRFPQTKVIVLSSHDEDAYLTNALRAGAKGYLLKNTAAVELANTIRSVHKGYSQVGPGLFDKIVARMSGENGLQAPAASLESMAGSLPDIELQLLLKGFDAQTLSEVATRPMEKGTASHLFTYLSRHLQRDPTNLAALYLAGVLAHRVQADPLLAFQYLQFGFQQAIAQGLPPASLLLFYREGALLKPEQAFRWLTQVDSPFNSSQGMSFLLQQATQLFGPESTSYQILLVLAQIRAMRQFSESCLSLSSRLEDLQQGFQRLNQALQII
jgi:DNA-binding NarL/FixJ family response regulator